MRPDPRLVVVDLDRVHPEIERDLTTIWYSGVLTAETLEHLAHCARLREQRDAEKLAEILTRDPS